MLNLKKFRLILLAALVLSITLVVDLLTTALDLPPENVLVANLTDSSAAITWTTVSPSRGGVALSTQGNKVLRTLEFFLAPRRYVPDEINATTHYVFLKDLAPQTAYYYRIFAGGRLWKQGSEGRFLPNLKTAAALPAPTLPNPIFGQLVYADYQPAVQALVTFWLVSASNPDMVESKPLTAHTDDQGFWQVDLGNFRAFDGQRSLSVTSLQALAIRIITTTKQSQSALLVLYPNQRDMGKIVLK